MKILKYILVLIVLGIVLFFVFQNKIKQKMGIGIEPAPVSVACTQEAKLCPDGSYVSRTGPNCEFTLCPNAPILNSGITGAVALGPTCPVSRIPPDPNCVQKFYSTSIDVMNMGSTQILRTAQSDANGLFHVDLAPGAYTLQAKGGNPLPRCGEVSVAVTSGQYTTAKISCDTGIR